MTKSAANYLQLGSTKAVREQACLLRAEAPRLGHFTPDMLDALADEVDRLRTENERLERELSETRKQVHCDHKYESNYAMNDTTWRYCTKCGRAE